MQLRRKIMNECKGNPRLQKAVAMAVYIKHCLGRSSLMQDYSINKLHTITGVSATTLKKYIPILIQEGWITFNGKNNQHLMISNIASHTDKRNINVDAFCFDSYKDVYRSLRAFLALTIQAHKDFVKRTIQIATNPQKGEDCKAARKLVKRLVAQGVLRSLHHGYREFGLSLKRIAREVGSCVRTAQRIMNYAVAQNFVTKYHNFEQVCAKNVHYMDIDGYTYTSNNNMYIVKANLYVLNSSVANALCYAGSIRW